MSDYTIGDLEQLAGIPRRTIYFYVQQGILPPPSGAGLAARYRPAHLWRLRAIPRLRAAGWRLDRIRAFFNDGPEEDLEAIANGRILAEPPSPVLEASPVAEASTPAAPEGETAPTVVRRYHLARGIELLVDEDLPPDTIARVHHLLATARLLLADGTSGADSWPPDHPFPRSRLT